MNTAEVIVAADIIEEVEDKSHVTRHACIHKTREWV